MQEVGLSITLQQVTLKVAKLIQTKHIPFQNGILGNNQWFWFKHCDY
jgi:hypothetical protein